MNLQTVSSTDFQKNMSQIASMSNTNPVLITKHNQPEKILIKINVNDTIPFVHSVLQNHSQLVIIHS